MILIHRSQKLMILIQPPVDTTLITSPAPAPFTKSQASAASEKVISRPPAAPSVKMTLHTSIISPAPVPSTLKTTSAA